MRMSNHTSTTKLSTLEAIQTATCRRWTRAKEVTDRSRGRRLRSDCQADVKDLEAWMRDERAKISRHSDPAKGQPIYFGDWYLRG
jgi:hypothetical protein